MNLGLAVISPRDFVALLTGWESRGIRPVCEGLPEDAEVLAATYDFARDEFCIKVRHQSFPLVRQGEQIPVVCRIEVEADDATMERRWQAIRRGEIRLDQEPDQPTYAVVSESNK